MGRMKEFMLRPWYRVRAAYRAYRAIRRHIRVVRERYARERERLL